MKIINKISKSADYLIDWAYRKRFNRYNRMLQWGRISQLLALGKSDYVIAHFADFRLGCSHHNDKDAYAPYAMLITPAMMKNYLYHNPENFFFFTMHPKGLQILAEQEFAGAIARLEKEFLEIARNFPDSFKLNENSHREYVQLLNKYLDFNLPLPH